MTDVDDALAFGAQAAAVTLLADAEAFGEIFSNAFDERAARFVRVSGDVSGEALFRWMAGKELHPFKGEEWPKVAPDFRLFFEGFAAVVKVLAPLLDPPKPAAGTVIHPAVPKIDVNDTIFRKYGRPGEPTHGRLSADTPRTTQGLTIIPNAPAPGAVSPEQFVAYADAPIVIAGDTLTRFEKGAPPTPQEFMAMTPEQRRPYAALFGMPGIEEINNETPGPAPEAEGLAPMTIEGEVGGERIAGTVSIGRTKRGGK